MLSPRDRSMDTEYRRVGSRRHGPATQTTDLQSRPVSERLVLHLKRFGWVASAVFLIHRLDLLRQPPLASPFFSLAVLSLLLFAVSFLYCIVRIRSAFGYGPQAPRHSRWKNYVPRAIMAMSASSFTSYCFTALAYYRRLGAIAFPCLAVVFYGCSCLLSYL